MINDIIANRAEFLGAIIVITIMWFAQFYFVRYYFGWRYLIRVYKINKPFLGKAHLLGLFSLNIFSKLFEVGVNNGELFLGVAFILKPGNPDILVPLSEVAGYEHKGILRKGVILKFKNAPKVKILVSYTVANFIEKKSAYSWRYSREKK